MSETLKTSGEKSAESTNTNHFEVLAEMSGKFDADKARQLAEQHKPKNTEKPKTEQMGAAYLAVMPEKQEKELSPQDAANEYLSLLDELSQDFTYPFYQTNGKGQQHIAGGKAKDLGRKYSDNPSYHWEGYIGTEAGGAGDRTLVRMHSADFLLAHEIGWREEGKKVGEKMEQFDKSIADLDADYSKKGRLGRFFGKRKYEKARRELESSKRATESRFNQKYNEKIAKELAISYNEKGDYDYNGGDFGKSQNEARNRRFFGLDDPERAKKVERAIELRQKYETEWSKKK